MRVTRLTLRNWLSFRGTHSLAFGPGAHGVTARLESDAERSNWLGKSSFLGAFRFALYGSFRHLGGCEREGDWISRGESEGGVRLELDDGTVVDRRRGKGSTELAVRIAGVGSRGDRAAELLLRHVGLGEDDFCAVAFFEQGRLSRMVKEKARGGMTPAERQEVVSEWLRLGPLRKAEEAERRLLAALASREGRLAAQREALERVLSGAARPTPEQLDEAAGTLREATGEVARFERAEREALAREAEAQARRETVEKREFLVDAIARLEGDAVEEKHAAALVLLPDLRERASSAAAALKIAERDSTVKRRLATAGFDGKCPVAPLVCPAAERINAMRSENASDAQGAEAREKTARGTSERATEKLRAAEVAAREVGDAVSRLANMREIVRKLAADSGEESTGEAANEISIRLASAREALRAADARSRELERELAAVERFDKELAEIDAELAAVRREAQTSREAAAILGRAGAQRRLARRALEEIETRANERLSRAEIDLSLSFEWGRETAKPAAECEACGSPFPSSTRTKECGACSAPRGRQVEEGLWVRLSDRSGAAEDLAGFELGVAAGEWLREERGASWGVLFADEPFGALDAAHRRALAGSVARVLVPGGYEQAFVVAHHPGLMDGLPGRVRIVSDGRDSRFDI